MNATDAAIEAATIETGRYRVARISGRYRVIDNGGAILATVASKAVGQKWIDRKVQTAVELAEQAVAEQDSLAATAPALGKVVSEPLPGEAAPAEEPTKAYRIGKVLREFVLSRPVAAGTGELVAHVATRNVCYDGTATLRLTRAMAERLIDAAGDLEVVVTGSADENPVPVAQRAPAVMAARAARRSLYKLFG